MVWSGNYLRLLYNKLPPQGKVNLVVSSDLSMSHDLPSKRYVGLSSNRKSLNCEERHAFVNGMINVVGSTAGKRKNLYHQYAF